MVPPTPAKMSAMCEYSLSSRSATLIPGFSAKPMIRSILTSSGSLSMNFESELSIRVFLISLPSFVRRSQGYRWYQQSQGKWIRVLDSQIDSLDGDLDVLD